MYFKHCSLIFTNFLSPKFCFIIKTVPKFTRTTTAIYTQHRFISTDSGYHNIIAHIYLRCESIACLLYEKSKFRGFPIALLHEKTDRFVKVNDVAERKGLRIGMTPDDSLSKCPNLKIFSMNNDRNIRTYEKVLIFLKSFCTKKTGISIEEITKAKIDKVGELYSSIFLNMSSLRDLKSEDFVSDSENMKLKNVLKTASDLSCPEELLSEYKNEDFVIDLKILHCAMVLKEILLEIFEEFGFILNAGISSNRRFVADIGCDDICKSQINIVFWNSIQTVLKQKFELNPSDDWSKKDLRKIMPDRWLARNRLTSKTSNFKQNCCDIPIFVTKPTFKLDTTVKRLKVKWLSTGIVINKKTDTVDDEQMHIDMDLDVEIILDKLLSELQKMKSDYSDLISKNEKTESELSTIKSVYGSLKADIDRQLKMLKTTKSDYLDLKDDIISQVENLKQINKSEDIVEQIESDNLKSVESERGSEVEMEIVEKVEKEVVENAEDDDDEYEEEEEEEEVGSDKNKDLLDNNNNNSTQLANNEMSPTIKESGKIDQWLSSSFN